MKKRILALVAVVALLATLLSACAPKVDTSGTLRLGTPEHNQTYNPLYWSTGYDNAFVELIYEGLVEVDDSGKAVVNKLLVDGDVEISEDQLSYTFKIKKGVKFSSGDALTADDVVFTYKVMASPKTAPRNTGALDSLRNGRDYKAEIYPDFDFVEKIDDQTVTFHFSEILRSNLGACDTGILSEKHYEGIDWENPDEMMNEKMQDPMGTGPYKLGPGEPGQFYTLEFNETYHAAKETDYKIKKIMNKVVTDLEMEELEADNLDFLPGQISKDKIDRAKASDKFGFNAYQRSGYGYIGFNAAWGPSADKSFRQAVAYLIDRDKYVEVTLGEYGFAPDVPMSPASSIYDAIVGDLTKYAVDKDKALEILKADGYEYDGTVMKKNGEPVVVKFYGTQDNDMVEALLPLLNDGLASIGIKLETETLDWSAFIEVVQAEDPEGWNMYFMASGWTSDEPNTWTSGFTTAYIPQGNTTRYSNPAFDQLLEEGRRILDISSKEAVDIYSKAGLMLNEDLPALPLYSNTYHDIFNKRVENLKTDTFVDWTKALGKGASINKDLELAEEELAGTLQEGGE